MISQFTRDKAVQLSGMVDYEKNVHVLNEVEKTIKYDSSKLAVFCSTLHNVPTLKECGDQILQETGLSITQHLIPAVHIPSATENISIQHDQSVHVDYDIATDIMCLESKYFQLLDNTKAALHTNAVPLEGIQFFIERHIGTGTVYGMSRTLDSLFGRLKCETSFLDYAIIRALVETYVADSTVENECIIYIQKVKKFCNSTTLAALKKDCEEKIALLPNTKKVLLKVDDRWNNVTIANFKRLLKIIFHNLFTRMEVRNGSLVITWTVLDNIPKHEIVTRWVYRITFMKAIGVLLLQVGDTVIYEASEQENTSKTLEEGLSKALQSGNVSAVELLLAVNINTYQSVHILISKAVTMSDCNGYTVLHRASEWGHDDVVQLLLKTGQYGIRSIAADGMTPLMLAAINGHISTTALLILRIYISGCSCDYELYDACEKGYIQAVHSFLRCGANPSVAKENGWTPLIVASYEGHTKVVTALLNSEHDIVNAQTLHSGRTALSSACQYGDYDTASALLKAKADPNLQTKQNKWTPLTIAAKKGHTNIVQLLLEHGADINYGSITGATALIVASEHGYTDIAKILLERGADASIETTTGDTAISIAVSKGWKGVVEILYANQYEVAYPTLPKFLGELLPLDLQNKKQSCIHLLIASYNGHNDVVNSLVCDGVDVNTRDKKKQTALHCACINGHSNVITTLLQSNADPTIQDNNGYTPLMMACATNHEESACALLVSEYYSLDTYIDIQNSYGETALHLACKQDNSKIVSTLLNANANPYILSMNKETALSVALKHNHDNIVKLFDADVAKELYNCCYYGDVTGATSLLKRDADPSVAQENGWTPLIIASYKGQKQIVTELLKRKSDYNMVNAQTDAGVTALYVACQFGDHDIASILLNAKADPNIQTKDGWTPLTLASSKGYINTVQLLLEHSADINYRSTVTGDTALILACKYGHTKMVRLLLERGADLSIKNTNGDTAIDVVANENSKDILELLRIHQYKLVRSVSQLLTSSFTESLKFSDEKSFLSKVTLSSDTTYMYKVLTVPPKKDQTSLITETTVDSGISGIVDDGQSRSYDTRKDDIDHSGVQGKVQMVEPSKDDISVVTVDSGVADDGQINHTSDDTRKDGQTIDSSEVK